MSRVGKKPIQIPEGIEVMTEGHKVTVKGPKGEISREIRPEIKVEIKEDKIFVSVQEQAGARKKDLAQNKAFWGLSRALLSNLVEGVSKGFGKKLEIQGVGFKAAVEGTELVLYVGFSIPVKLKIPPGINTSIEKNIVSVSGIDKELVGQFAANIRKVKPPEPYKGKGIRYLGEQVRRKLGKKVVATTT